MKIGSRIMTPRGAGTVTMSACGLVWVHLDGTSTQRVEWYFEYQCKPLWLSL
jgi:hypothetical protein